LRRIDLRPTLLVAAQAEIVGVAVSASPYPTVDRGVKEGLC
jgi:hypothetical protein